MSEEEIIEIIEKLQCEYKEQQNDKKYNDYTVFKAKEYSKGLQGLLDLYTHRKGRVEELKQELLEEKELSENRYKEIVRLSNEIGYAKEEIKNLNNLLGMKKEINNDLEEGE